MNASITGAGARIVLIHGWAGSARIMSPLASDLDGAYECHCIDLPGHGSTASGRIDIGLDAMITETADYVRALGAPVILLGWAMGALISLAVATRVAVKGVICIGTPSGGAELGPAFEKMADRLVHDWPRYVRSSVDVIVGDRVSPEMHGYIRSIMQATSPSLARRTLLEVARTDPAAYAVKVDAPVLVLHGEEDKISPVSIARKLGEVLTNAKVTLYPGIGHAPFLEHRAATTASIKHFLETLDV